MMKYISAILFFSVAISVSKGNTREHIHTKDCNHGNGYYAKLGYGLQDGLNGGKNAS